MENVLLVDDDSICNLLSEKILNSLGITSTIRKAINGQQAIDIICDDVKQNVPRPNFILLDLNMPVMNGIEFIQQFNAMNFPEKETITIIVVSSSLDLRDIHKVNQLGIKHFLAKPLNKEAISKILID
jgi:CheY-like chemotaxis protein